MIENNHRKSFLSDRIIWLYAAIYCILIFFVLRERTLIGHDPANYFLAVKYGFSLAAERPHAPGYPLLVFLWQQIYLIFHIDPHTAIEILNVVFLFFSIGLCYYFVKKYWSKATAIIATSLIVFNPVVLYYSNVAEIYIYDLFFSIGIIYLVLSCKSRLVPFVFFLVGLAMGFRLSSVILLAPVIVLTIFMRDDWKKLFSLQLILLSFVSLVCGITIWAMPYYISTGGFLALQTALHEAAELTSTIYQNAAVYLSYFICAVNIAALVLFIRTPKSSIPSRRIKILLTAWFVFPTLFFISEHYAKGYILLILPSFIIPISHRISLILNDRIRRWVFGFLITCDLALFFFVPFVAPSVESSLPKKQRSSGERIQTAVLRSLSFFAPTYSHIQTSDEAITEANVMLRNNCKPLSWIIVDNSAGSWATPRSLQARNPSLYFIHESLEDSTVTTLYYGSEIDRNFPVQYVLSKESLYYITDRRSVSSFGEPPDSKLLFEGKWLSFYLVKGTNKDPFWKYFNKSK